MAGLHTLDSSSSSSTFLALEERILSASGDVLCYSRLPMRQLLRYLPSNRAEMWWISEHESPQSVMPDPEGLVRHVSAHSSSATELIVIEGLDWIVERSSTAAALRMIQSLDALSRQHAMDLVFSVDAIALPSTFWSRLCSVAPKLELDINHVQPENTEVKSIDSLTNESPLETVPAPDDKDTTLVHLVSLPRVGFTHAILARRMLQWKRMGFDLAALEPASTMADLDEAHRVYEAVESDITATIDAVRYMEAQRDKLSVTEREVYNYRLMSLSNTAATVEELERLMSSR